MLTSLDMWTPLLDVFNIIVVNNVLLFLGNFGIFSPKSVTHSFFNEPMRWDTWTDAWPVSGIQWVGLWEGVKNFSA